MDAPLTSTPTAAPAPEAPVTQTAVEHAAVTGDFKSFRAAKRAERSGAPLDAVPVTEPAADAPAAPAAPIAAASGEPKLSKRQQDINDRAQLAVDRATVALREENDRLKAQLAAPSARREPEPAKPAAPSAAPAEKFPTLAEYSAAHPDASLEDYVDARADWRDQQRSKTTAARTEAEELTAAQQQRVEKFVTRLNETKAADPAFVSKLSPEVKELRPFGALKPGEASGPRNVIAEQIYDSPIAPKVLLHFSHHPEDLTRLSTMPPEIAALPRGAQVHSHIQWIVREFGKLESRLETPASAAAAPAKPTKTISDAPSVDTLGHRASEAADPVLSAAVKGDFRQFRAAKRAERAARMSK